LARIRFVERGTTGRTCSQDRDPVPVDAVERRDAFLVGGADAVVVVWKDRDPDVGRVLALVERKGLPVHLLGGPERRPKARRARAEEAPRRGGMLPD
jgi:hypothetical protein